MKDIINYSREIELEARGNVEHFGFDEEICPFVVFNILNEKRVIMTALNQVTDLKIEDPSQIVMHEKFGLGYGVVLENDGELYPTIDLVFVVKRESNFDRYFCLSLTPFNARLTNVLKSASFLGGCDKELSRCWRIILKGFLKDKWVEAFEKYKRDVEKLKENLAKTDDSI